MSRVLDTRGHVFIGSEGHLSSSWIVCQSARVEGKVSGTLRVESELVLQARASMSCKISAQRLVVERGHSGEIFPKIQVGEALIHGTLTASILCGGELRIARGARFYGDVIARSLIVEKGGSFIGACAISADAVSAESPRDNVSFIADLRPAVVR